MKKHFISLVATLFSFTSLLACSVTPFVTSNPVVMEPDGLQVVSICYNASEATKGQLRSIAAGKCKEDGSSAEYFRHDKMLNDLSLIHISEPTRPY